MDFFGRTHSDEYSSFKQKFHLLCYSFVCYSFFYTAHIYTYHGYSSIVEFVVDSFNSSPHNMSFGMLLIAILGTWPSLANGVGFAVCIC